MKAIIQERYGPPGDVLELREVERPEIESDEVLVRVCASALAGDDWHLVRGLPYIARLSTGLKRPKNPVPGRDVAGRVEAVGSEVTRFEPGDEVFGWCEGGFAEYTAVKESALAPRPENLGMEEAAVVPVSGFTALQALRDEGRIEPGQEVLIVGASGGVGTFAVQIAKSFGAEVTGVCSTRNADLIRSLGADRVIDYTQEDFTQGDLKYDLIVDLVAGHSLSEMRRALAPHGTLVMVGSAGAAPVDGARLGFVDRWFMGVHLWVRALFVSLFTRQRLRPLVHADRLEDLLTLKELIEAGEVTPLVSARYRLEEIQEAMAHHRAGHARGKTVISI